MESIINSKDPEDTYTLISTNNYFPLNPSVSWIDVNIIVSDLKSNYKSIDKMWGALRSENKSDLIRYYFAQKAENSQMYYIDCDVEFKSWPEVKYLDNPYFAKIGNASVNNHVFNVNGKYGYMMELLKKVIALFEQSYAATGYVAYAAAYVALNNQFRARRCHLIPDGHFIHHQDA